MIKILGVLSVALVPSVALAAPRTFAELAVYIVDILNSGVIVLVTLAIVVYFLGISSNVLNIAEDPEAKRRFFFWGIIVLFVMLSVWGILEIVENTILSGGGGAGTMPGGGFEPCDSFGNCFLE